MGEGLGAIVGMSEWRASEDALRRVYLGGGRLDGGLPTDAWARQGAEFKGWKPSSGWTEVEHESREGEKGRPLHLSLRDGRQIFRTRRTSRNANQLNIPNTAVGTSRGFWE